MAAIGRHIPRPSEIRLQNHHRPTKKFPARRNFFQMNFFFELIKLWRHFFQTSTHFFFKFHENSNVSLSSSLISLHVHSHFVSFFFWWEIFFFSNRHPSHEKLWHSAHSNFWFPKRNLPQGPLAAKLLNIPLKRRNKKNKNANYMANETQHFTRDHKWHTFGNTAQTVLTIGPSGGEQNGANCSPKKI